MTLFDQDDGAFQLTVSEESDIARPARAGFLAGVFAVWLFRGKPTKKQQEALLVFARDIAAQLPALLERLS